MSHLIRVFVCLFALATFGSALAQNAYAQTAQTSAETAAKPVAHVYVNSGSGIVGFDVAADGKLTAISGSPFHIDVSLAGGNGHYLFGFQPSSVVIASLSIAANGALKETATLNTENYNPTPDCALTYWNGQGLAIDHSGADLYNAAIPADFPCRTTYQSFKIKESDGVLSFLGTTGDVLLGGASINILGNNQFIYTPSCNAAFGNGPYPYVGVFRRSSSGKLATTTSGVAIPAAPNDTYSPEGGSTPGYYCPIAMATDPTNHVAMTLYAIDNDTDGGGAIYGPRVIATYAADANGNLKTTSTYKNMATLPVDNDYEGDCLACSALSIAPSGKLLAAGGPAGVLLFHFNGGSPVTKYKTLLAGNNIGTILWDNDNHMYALGTDSKGTEKLWVYTVTTSSVAEASGSPYAITNAGGMYVQPLK